VTEEQWLDIPGYEGYYQVSDAGRIRSLDRTITYKNGKRYRKRGRVLRPAIKAGGYLQVALNMNAEVVTPKVHSLVALAFLGERPAGLQVCHNNGDPSDNRPENLRYDTPASNSADIIAHGNNRQRNKTHCKWGHEFTPENTGTRSRKCRPRENRMCKTCKNTSERLRYAIRRDARLSPQEKVVIEELRREREAAMIATGCTT